MSLGTLVLTQYKIFCNSSRIGNDFKAVNLNKDLVVSYSRRASTGEFEFVTRFQGKPVVILTQIKDEDIINSSKIGNFYMIHLRGEDINE